MTADFFRSEESLQIVVGTEGAASQHRQERKQDIGFSQEGKRRGSDGYANQEDDATHGGGAGLCGVGLGLITRVGLAELALAQGGEQRVPNREGHGHCQGGGEHCFEHLGAELLYHAVQGEAMRGFDQENIAGANHGSQHRKSLLL